MKLNGTEIRFGSITFQQALDRNISKELVVYCHNEIWNYVTRSGASNRTMKREVKKYLKDYLDYDFTTPNSDGKKPDDTFIDKWFTTIAKLHPHRPSPARGNEFKQQYLEGKGIGSLSGFIERVVEIHEYNLLSRLESRREGDHQEKPTLELAYRELIIEILQENSPWIAT